MEELNLRARRKVREAELQRQGPLREGDGQVEGEGKLSVFFLKQSEALRCQPRGDANVKKDFCIHFFYSLVEITITIHLHKNNKKEKNVLATLNKNATSFLCAAFALERILSFFWK